MNQLRVWLAYCIMPKDTRKFFIKALNDKKKISWLGKNCKDCGNEKCKKLGTLPKGHDCALWQPEK